MPILKVMPSDFEYQLSVKLDPPNPHLELEELSEAEQFQDVVDEVITTLSDLVEEISFEVEALADSRLITISAEALDSDRTLAELDGEILRRLHAIKETGLEIQGGGTYNLDTNPNPLYQRLPGLEPERPL